MFSFSGGGATPMPIVNSIFTGNSSVSDGGALFSDLTILDLINCTFSLNTGGSRGGGLYNYVGCAVTVTNSVFRDNSDMFGAGEESQAYNNPSNLLSLNHTCVQGWTGSLGGVNNTGADPQLVDPLGPDGSAGTEDDNLRLASGSPCIDAGDNAVVIETLDLDGNPRIVDHDGDGTATVDMGAYEAQPSGGPVPTVSEWGMIVMTILLIAAGTIILRYRQPRAVQGAF